MTWTRISDDFADREDLLGCSRSARLLYVELLVYGNRLGLDGRIPRTRLPRFTDAPEAVEELVAAGVVAVDGEILVVDWTDQEPSETVEKRRNAARARQSMRRDRMASHLAGDHSDCLPNWDCRRSSRRDKRSDSQGEVTQEVTRPRPVTVPSRPKGEGRDTQDDFAGDAAKPTCAGCGLASGKHAFDCEAVAS